MSNGITPLRRSDVLDGVAKFFRVMEKEGVEWTHYQHPVSSKTARRNLAEYLKLGCPKVENDGTTLVTPTTSTGSDLARLILGNDFITPEEVANARNLTYSDEQLAMFGDTLPSEDVIKWCQANGFIIVAGPPSPMSLLQIRDLTPQHFYTKTGGWYAEEKQRFSREQKVETRWLAIRKAPVPNSTSKNWDEQQSLLSGVEYVPNDAEVEWAVTTYKAVRDVYLLPGIYARTSSVDSDGNHVYVGNFDSDGLDVSSDWDGRRRGSIGVASARKF